MRVNWDLDGHMFSGMPDRSKLSPDEKALVKKLFYTSDDFHKEIWSDLEIIPRNKELIESRVFLPLEEARLFDDAFGEPLWRVYMMVLDRDEIGVFYKIFLVED